MFFELNGITFDYDEYTFDKHEILKGDVASDADAINAERKKRNELISEYICEDAIANDSVAVGDIAGIKTNINGFKLSDPKITQGMVDGIDLEDDLFYRHYNNPKTLSGFMLEKFYLRYSKILAENADATQNENLAVINNAPYSLFNAVGHFVGLNANANSVRNFNLATRADVSVINKDDEAQTDAAAAADAANATFKEYKIFYKFLCENFISGVGPDDNNDTVNNSAKTYHNLLFFLIINKNNKFSSMYLQLKDIGILNMLVYMIQHNKNNVSLTENINKFYTHLATDVRGLFDDGVQEYDIQILSIAHHIINIYTSFEGYSNYNVFNKEFIELCRDFIDNSTENQINLLTRNSKIFLLLNFPYKLLSLKNDKKKSILSGLNNSDITFLFNNCSNIDKFEIKSEFNKLSNISFYVNKFNYPNNAANPKINYPLVLEIPSGAGIPHLNDEKNIVAGGVNYGNKEIVGKVYSMLSEMIIGAGGANAVRFIKDIPSIFKAIYEFILVYKTKTINKATDADYNHRLLYISDEYCNETNQLYLIDMINNKKSITNFKVLYNNIFKFNYHLITELQYFINKFLKDNFLKNKILPYIFDYVGIKNTDIGRFYLYIYNTELERTLLSKSPMYLSHKKNDVKYYTSSFYDFNNYNLIGEYVDLNNNEFEKKSSYVKFIEDVKNINFSIESYININHNVEIKSKYKYNYSTDPIYYIKFTGDDCGYYNLYDEYDSSIHGFSFIPNEEYINHINSLFKANKINGLQIDKRKLSGFKIDCEIIKDTSKIIKLYDFNNYLIEIGRKGVSCKLCSHTDPGEKDKVPGTGSPGLVPESGTVISNGKALEAAGDPNNKVQSNIIYQSKHKGPLQIIENDVNVDFTKGKYKSYKNIIRQLSVDATIGGKGTTRYIQYPELGKAKNNEMAIKLTDKFNKYEHMKGGIGKKIDKIEKINYKKLLSSKKNAIPMVGGAEVSKLYDNLLTQYQLINIKQNNILNSIKDIMNKYY